MRGCDIKLFPKVGLSLGELYAKLGIPQEMRGVGHANLVFCLLWEVEETWDVPNKIIDDLLRYGVVLQIEKTDVDEGMSELVDELRLVSLVVDESKVEDRDSREVASHRKYQVCSWYCAFRE